MTAMTADELLAGIRNAYDLTPNLAAADILAAYPRVLDWLGQYAEPTVRAGHISLSLDTAAFDLASGHYMLSGGESVLARTAIGLLAGNYPVNITEWWRLDRGALGVVLNAIARHQG